MNTTNVEEEKTKLKTGYTTGSCATAASKAALLSVINQQKIENVDILLPKRSFITFANRNPIPKIATSPISPNGNATITPTIIASSQNIATIPSNIYPMFSI